MTRCTCAGHLAYVSHEVSDERFEIRLRWVIDTVDPDCPTHGDQSPTDRT